MSSPQFREVSIAAAYAGMRVVRSFQLGERTVDGVTWKPDDTIVTVCDRESQQAIFDSIGSVTPGAVLIGEEKTDYATELNIQSNQGQDGWLVDPLDGTSALAQGLPTSTVVVAYRYGNEIVGCTIGEPISGRVWSAEESGWCECLRFDLVTGRLISSLSQYVGVWAGNLEVRKSVVYLDVSHGWKACGTTEAHMACLLAGLNGISNVIMPGSNALMQALVANGGTKVAGSISTAKGGPWDLAGVRLVLAAGGCARGYARTGESWEACNPLDVDTTDVLICANSEETLEALSGIFLKTMS